MSASARSSWWPLGLVLCLGLALMGWMLAKSQAPTSHAEPRAVSAVAPEHESALPVVPSEQTAEPQELQPPTPNSALEAAARAGTPEAPHIERVSGRLRRLSDGSPLAGWVVSLESRRGADASELIGFAATAVSPPALPPGEVLLDAAGRFELAEIPPGHETFFVSPLFTSFGQDLSLRLSWDGLTTELDRVVDTGWILEGHARSDSGHALVNGWALEREFPDPEHQRDISDSFLEVRSWQDMVLELIPHGSAEAVAEAVALNLAGISTRLDGHGGFRLLDLQPRDETPLELAVEVRADFHQPVGLKIELDAEARVVSGLLVELPAAGMIEGRVLAPDGLARVIQYADLSFAWSASGPRVLRSPRLVLPAVEGYLEPSYAREPGPTVFEQELQTRAALPRHFRVAGLAPGRHVLRLHLADRPPREGDSWTGYPTLNTSRGDSKTDPQHDGPSHAAPRRWVEEIEVTAGELTHVDIEVPWGAAMVGHVRDRAGAPLVNALVEAFEVREWRVPADAAPVIEEVVEFENGSLIRSLDDQGRVLTRLELRADLSRTESPGAFQLDRLSPGRLLLRVTPPDEMLRPLEQWIEVTSQQTLVHDVALEHAD